MAFTLTPTAEARPTERTFLRAHPTGAFLLTASMLLFTASDMSDVFLLGRVFRGPDPLSAALTYAMFGLAAGVPIRLFFAWLKPGSGSLSARGRRQAILSGTLSAVGLMAYLFSLGQSVSFAEPMANALPALWLGLASASSRRKKTFWIGASLILGAGLLLSQGANVSPGLVLAVTLRAATVAYGETAEQHSVDEPRGLFDGWRFAAMAGAGIPLAAVGLGLMNHLGEALRSAQDALWPWGLLFFAVMAFNFYGSISKMAAKKQVGLHTCVVANALRVGGFPLLVTGLGTVFPGFPAPGRMPSLPGLLLTIGGLIVITWSDTSRSPCRNEGSAATEGFPKGL